MNRPPNDQRFFVHKRIGRAAKGFVTSGFNPLSALGGFIASEAPVRMPTRVSRKSTFSRVVSRARAAAPVAIAPVAPPVRRPVSRTLTARPSAVSSAEKAAGRAAKFASIPLGGQTVSRALPAIIGAIRGSPDCPIPFQVWDEVAGKCVWGVGEQAGRDDTPIGDTVMGRYGAGETPGNMVVNRAICRPGMVLGDDGVCYNRTQITNKQREWPKGRRPLLTGGDMRAISVAARAGKRLTGATKRLQKIGLMKKPAPRARRITSGPTDHHHHE